MTYLRTIARSSPLSIKQVEEVKRLKKDIELEIDTLWTFGDKDKASSLRSNISGDFFTRELDEKILRGKADIAIHSAKDLPVPLHPELRVIALLKGHDSSDSLVSKNGETLKELPQGACIATSSDSRQNAVAALRSDLTFRDVRGTIEERIAQVDEGYADAVVVATCALKRLNMEKRISEVLPIETYPLQGHLAIVAHRSRPDLVKLWMDSDIRRDFGKVYLAGFGPGNPELMTLKTYRLLQTSDLILYDDLIDPSILKESNAEKIYVGKRKGAHCFSQKNINDLIKERSWKGQQVLRLKGGDPGIFGRAGEEVEFLQQWMIPFELVPGVTSALAAAASQNISLTQRNVSKKLCFLTGHHAQSRFIEVPKTDTIVYYMAASELKHLSQILINNGREKKEPVLLVQNATLLNEVSQKTTVEEMANTHLCSPLMVIVGKISQKSFTSPKVLYTGLDSSRYKSHANICHYPLIETKVKEDVPQNINLDQFEAVIFTSREAVKYFFQLYPNVTISVALAIGSGTARSLEKRGIEVKHLPKTPDSKAMLGLIDKLPYDSYLYLCSCLSKNSLHDNIKVTSLPIYDVGFIKQDVLDLSQFERIVFTSPSTVNSFLEIYGKLPKYTLFEVLGPLTRDHLVAIGVDLSHIIEPSFFNK
ncbi:uroporphyrinogen-III C-methyltransferase [PVC group bacterium (ex Bugula neritina AB1)]|nr:uroporphyrinogen-III C-methyltransferase [PVC group bacterium (ex Bugula neritina AB1)]